jgi:predicted Zn-dependent protease
MKFPSLRLRSAPLFPLAIAVAVVVAACATSPLGRTQLAFFPEADLATMGAAAFDKQKQDTPISRDGRTNAYVQCVAKAITDAVEGPYAGRKWEVVVFQSKQVNAFALPGGKIGVYTGLLEVAANQDQLAAVIGHEVAHVLSSHANERVSQAYAADMGAQLASVALGGDTASQRQLYALIGLGTQVGVLLPFGRTQESEADLVGQDLMARAGFDPRQSTELWKNMERASGGQAPPEWLSTHPSHSTRINNLGRRLEVSMPLFEKARAAGRRPKCR